MPAPGADKSVAAEVAVGTVPDGTVSPIQLVYGQGAEKLFRVRLDSEVRSSGAFAARNPVWYPKPWPAEYAIAVELWQWDCAGIDLVEPRSKMRGWVIGGLGYEIVSSSPLGLTR